MSASVAFLICGGGRSLPEKRLHSTKLIRPVGRSQYSSTQVMTAQVPVLSGHDHPAGSGSAGVRRSLQTGVSRLRARFRLNVSARCLLAPCALTESELVHSEVKLVTVALL